MVKKDKKTKKTKNKNKEKIEEYSSDFGNLSVVEDVSLNEKKEINKNINLEKEGKEFKEGLSLNKDGLEIGKSSSLIIGKIDINSAFKKRHDEHYKDSKFHLIVDSIMGLIIIFLLVFVLWLSFWQPKNNIILSSKTDGLVSSGDIETFILKYETKSKIKDANLSIKLPNNFILLDVIPKNVFNENTKTFNLKNLYSGANGEIKISGYVLGEVGGSQSLGYTFNCKNCGVNGMMGSLFYNIEDSVLDMRVIKSDIFYSNLKTPIEIILENNGQNNFNDLSLKINNNWRILDNENVFNNKIILKDIEAGESKKISFSVLPLSENLNSLDLSLYLEKDGKEYLQKTFSDQVEITNPKLKTILNKDVKSINIGDKVSFSLTYDNNEDDYIDDLNFKIRISDNFKLKNLNLEESNSKIKILNDLIIIEDRVLKGQKRTINLSAEIELIEEKKNQLFKIFSETNYSFENNSISYQTATEDIKVLSDLQASVKAYYYSPQGDQIGIGPLPPKIGLPTTYWIFLDFENQGNELKDFSLSGKLSDSVFWTNRKSVLSGNLSFNNVNNRFVWDIDNIDFSQSGEAKMAINLQPKEHMSGKVVNILEDINLKAYDVFAEKWINIPFLNLDTNLKSDNLSSGQGTVQP